MVKNDTERQPRRKRINFRQDIEDFSEGTTLHGLRFALGSKKGIYRRVIWLLLILAGFGFLTTQLVKSCKKLLAREHVITRDIISTDKLIFPAITICNVNMMKKREIMGTDAQVYLDEQNTFKELVNMARNTKSNESDLNSFFDIEKAVLNYGHNAKDMITVCTWDGDFCNHLNFTRRLSQIYGLCHTFNSGSQGHPLLYSSSIKRSHRLHLLIDVQKDEYYGIASYFNTGIRMAIHDQNEEPMMETNGIDVMPGHMTTINIQRTEYHSLPRPAKSPCDNKSLETSKFYTQSTCLMECNTRRVIRKCGCRLLGMPDLPEFNGTSYCNPRTMASCLLPNLIKWGSLELSIENVLAKYFIYQSNFSSSENPKSECKCPKQCTKVQYKIAQLNTVSLLSESFWEDFRSFFQQSHSRVNIMKRRFSQNYAFLTVYYDNLQTIQTSEKLAYELIDLGADVGGYLGLFLGCSILTLFEFFDFIICYLLRKRDGTKLET